MTDKVSARKGPRPGRYVPVCVPAAASSPASSSLKRKATAGGATKKTSGAATKQHVLTAAVPTIIQNYYYGAPSPSHVSSGQPQTACRPLMGGVQQERILESLLAVPVSESGSRRHAHMHFFVRDAFETMLENYTGGDVVAMYDELASRLYKGAFKGNVTAKYIVLYMLLRTQV